MNHYAVLVESSFHTKHLPCGAVKNKAAYDHLRTSGKTIFLALEGGKATEANVFT